MGILKKKLNESSCNYLTKIGFQYGKRSGPQGEEGYTKTIFHNENEVLWITIDLFKKKVYLYNEWDCGGELWQQSYDIPESMLDNEMDIISWLDEII